MGWSDAADLSVTCRTGQQCDLRERDHLWLGEEQGRVDHTLGLLSIPPRLECPADLLGMPKQRPYHPALTLERLVRAQYRADPPQNDQHLPQAELRKAIGHIVPGGILPVDIAPPRPNAMPLGPGGLMSARKPVGQKKPRLTGAHEPLHDAQLGAGISAGFLSCHASHASQVQNAVRVSLW